jgi:hypothetical protein
MIPPGYWLWIAIFVFYLGEHLKLAAPDTAIVSLDGCRRFDVGLARVPFLFGARQAVVLPLLPGWRIAARGRLAPRQALTPHHGVTEARKLRLLQRRLRPFADAEPYVFLIYFGVLPAFTALRGLVFALLVFAPLQLAILAYFWWLLAGYRPLASEGDRKLCRWCLALEMVVAPGIIPAISRRLAFAHAVPGDAALAFAGRLTPRRRAALVERVKFRVEELVSYQELGEAEASAYVAALEGAP